jgi:hypothetical protein
VEKGSRRGWRADAEEAVSEHGINLAIDVVGRRWLAEWSMKTAVVQA